MTDQVIIRGVDLSWRTPDDGRVVLDGASLEVARGEFVAVRGPSGSGKTTLVNLLAGLQLPSAGEVHVDTTRVDRLSSEEAVAWRRRHLGLAFQEDGLLPFLTAAENVDIGLRIAGVDRRERAQRVADVLEAVGVADLGHRRPSQLSGGQRRRVALARALAHRPSVVFCDEPTSALDVATAGEVAALLATVARTWADAVVAATHDSVVADAAVRVLDISDGRVVQKDAV